MNVRRVLGTAMLAAPFLGIIVIYPLWATWGTDMFWPVAQGLSAAALITGLVAGGTWLLMFDRPAVRGGQPEDPAESERWEAMKETTKTGAQVFGYCDEVGSLGMTLHPQSERCAHFVPQALADDTGRIQFIDDEQRATLLKGLKSASMSFKGTFDTAAALFADALEDPPPVRVQVFMPINWWQTFKACHAEAWWMAWLVRLRPVKHAVTREFVGRLESFDTDDDGAISVHFVGEESGDHRPSA